jgi:quaternary ammonium compound-resistance protein SugE
MNGWIALVLAGFCEIIWAVGLKYTVNFSKLLPSIMTIVAMVASLVLLNISLKTIPLSLSYAVWTGIGVMGTVLFGVMYFGETLNWLKVLSLGMIFLGIMGCKFSV